MGLLSELDRQSIQIAKDPISSKQLEKVAEEMQQEIIKMQHRFQVLVQESTDVFEIIGPDGTIIYINDAVKRVMGYTPDERIGKNIFDFYHGKQLEKIKDLVQDVLAKPSRKLEVEGPFRTKSGKNVILQIHMQNLLHDSYIGGIVINFRDITERVEKSRKIEYLATHDELTGLPNRAFFHKKLAQTCSENKRKRTFALMLLDLDGFQYINDALGYQFGDRLLRAIAQRLKVYLDDEQLLCHYAGDRFALILQKKGTINSYESIAKGILDLISEPFELEQYQINLTTSIGITVFPKDGLEADKLMKNANVALARAKNEGKNRYNIYSADTNIQSYKSFQLRNDLPTSIENNQLSFLYQPIVDLKTTEIVGADALIRWEHPSWGIVPTKELCAIAEEIGFIINLGKWMLEEVCRNYKEWLKKGLSPIKVALNYSGIQFFENNFAENVLNTIREYELDPSFLVIEITESTLIRNAEKVRKDIETLKTNGIQIALDDFGTGFSSLADLSAFPIDILKIDSLFIKNIAKDETCSVIAGSIINMARELQIKAVAEGIESWEQLSELKSLNCHAGQGYLYSKAVEPLEFTKLLAKKKCRPIRTQNVDTPKKQRRKFFRVEFIQSLEAEMTILEIKGKKIDVGNTKVLVKDIGPGGLCFISNIKLPIVKDFIMLFKTELLGKELKLTGYPVWGGEKDSNLYTYDVEFILDENDRSLLIHDLNKIQIKMRKKSLFTDGSFVTVSPAIYFKQFNN